MLDSRRPARPASLPAAVLWVVVLVSSGSVAWSQTSDPPPRSDTITALSQFLVCSGNPYALCYYSGPEAAPPGTKLPVPALPCVLGEHGKIATCKCYALEDGTSTNYVALPSILDPEVRKATEDACGEDGSGCLNMTNEKSCADASDSDSDSDSDSCRTAPVCDYLGDVEAGTGQTLYPKGALISTFSFANAVRYPISSTPCADEPYLRYAGCMTAACGEAYSENGQRFTECSCPTFVGPFQFGQSNSNLCCNLGDSNVWSAANLTVSISLPESSGDED